MGTPSLTFGSFLLTNPAGMAGTGTTRVLSEGTSRGNPVPIDVAVKSWLQDGSVVVTQGYDNREVRIRVRFFGDDLTDLVATEALLVAELGKPNTLTWTPANGPVSVFDVITSSLEFDDGDDTGEGQPYPWRTFNLRLVCAAFVRSASEVTVAALGASGVTTTNVDNGSATTGWTATVNGVSATVSVVSGAVKASSSAVTGTVTVSMSRSGSITTSSTNLLKIDWKPEAGAAGNPDLRAYGDGTELQKIASIPSPTAGFTRTWFKVAAASISTLRLDSTSSVITGGFIGYADPAVRSLYIDNIDRTDVKPAIGTNRQLQRTIPIGGSARAQFGIAVEHASSGLEDVIVYTFPDKDDLGRSLLGYSPPLRQFFSGSATVTSDANRVSGATHPLNSGSSTFDAPLRSLPICGHVLVARLLGSGASATINWSAQLFVGANSVGAIVSGSYTGTITTSYRNYPLAKFVLPTDMDDAASTAVLHVSISSTSAITFDEGWLFGEVGQLVMVRCLPGTPGVGGVSNRLWIDPPTTNRPRPTIRVGTAADRSDSWSNPTAVDAWQFPEAIPPQANVLTVTSGALDASVTAKGYPRWHSHAAS